MLSTLRRRLVLSHVLPLLVIIPLVGIALVYVLETQVVLVNLSSELVAETVLVAEIASDHTEVWYDPVEAQVFVARLAPHLSAQLMLLDPKGRLLASSSLGDDGLLGQRVEISGLAQALSGTISVRTAYSRDLHAEVADVLVPVLGSGQRVMGLVRLTHQLAGVNARFLRLRYLIVAILAGEVIVGAAVGWVLALNLENPLHRVSQAVYRLASGERSEPLPEEGPAEIRLLLQAFNTLVERLHTLEEARSQLLANLVHELGRPLGALRSAIQALLGGADQEPELRRELLAGMEAEVGHLQRLLDDVARLHDQVVGTLELNRRPVALGEWLPRMLAPWRAAAQEKGLHWESTFPADLPTLTVDPDRLAQALGNLVSNAIKYTPAGGTISAGAGVGGDAIWIRVSDTGPGIAPEDQERIFTPFYRGASARRFPQGMGLGLTIARDLAIAHGGRLEVDSTPGQGSHFTLWLPLRDGGER
jgi:signal transduction histidine kinase